MRENEKRSELNTGAIVAKTDLTVKCFFGKKGPNRSGATLVPTYSRTQVGTQQGRPHVPCRVKLHAPGETLAVGADVDLLMTQALPHFL